jgi:RNA polymerase sigma factor (TIGR02999 family)
MIIGGIAREDQDDSITDLLSRVSSGNRAVEASLVPRIYKELHRLAAHYMRGERLNHTLQPAVIVHEAYLRLARQFGVSWQSRTHFFAAASQLMRHILVDYARFRIAAKRGGEKCQVTLGPAVAVQSSRPVDVIALNESIERLSELDSRQGRIVMLHVFGGLSFEEIAFVLGVSTRTVKRDWTMARSWLRHELSK